MPISVELNEDQSARLQQLAKSMGVEPGELALAAINNLLSRPADDFQRATEHVLQKNKELYERLS